MSTPMSAGHLLAQLERWGVRYTTTPGWSTHNRNAYGPWGPVHGVLLHHTGDDAPDDADQHVLVNGRSDLPGPLCHWAMTDVGVVVLIGWGRANHAGKGAANVRDALLTEDYGAYPPAPGEDSVDGNQLLYGQETMYSGLHAPTAAAYAATVRMFAAICDFHGWSGKSCIGHKEWTSRKPDPGHLDMAQFRRDVDALLQAGPGGAIAPTGSPDPEEVTMKVAQIPGGRTFVINGPFSTEIDPGLASHWCSLTGQSAPAQVPPQLVSSTTTVATIALIQHLAGQAAAAAGQASAGVAQLAAAVAAMPDDVDEAALAARIVADLPDSIAQQVLDGLHARLAS